MSNTNIIGIMHNTKKVILTDVIDELMHEHNRIKRDHADMAKGLHLAIVYLMAKRNNVK